jgi:hypothetical protein
VIRLDDAAARRQIAADRSRIVGLVVQGRVRRVLGWGLVAYAAYAFADVGKAAFLLIALLWFMWWLSRTGEVEPEIHHRAALDAATGPPEPYQRHAPRQPRKIRGAK